MQVIATAGHVDHGKSTLVRALTGMEPDRWAEERRRGLTIDLGFAWMTLPSGQQVAFVDVPGHERFVPNMLAGVGAVPAILFTVAADEGWMPQSEEHLAAVHALGITHGLLAVTRSDLADPAEARRQALGRLAATSLGDVEAVAVSARTGLGLPALREALDRLAAQLPQPDPAAPVRLWVDRAFRIKGSGTVVTGTLPAGTIHAKQELLLTPSLESVRVRGIETLKQAAAQVSGVARVALNLRGPERVTPVRGMALIEPGRWTLAAVVDVRLATTGDRPPRQLTVHAGSARTTAQLRPLGGLIARLTLAEPLPLHVGDRLLLRDPGSAAAAFAQPGAGAGAGRAAPAGPGRPAWPPLVGAVVLDPAPPAFRRRGAAAAAGRELAAWPAVPTAADLLRRHGLLRAPGLRAMGLAELPAPVGGRLAGRPGALGHPGPATPGQRGRARRGRSRSRRACHWRRPGPRWACPPGSWSSAWPRRRWRYGPATWCWSVTAPPGPGRPSRTGCWRRCGCSMTIWPASHSPRRTPPGCANSGSTPARWRPRPGPGCCCGSPIRSSWRRARTRRRPGSWPGCRGRSPRPRPGRCCTPPGAWRSRCWSTWTAAGSPAGWPMTGAR